MDKKAKIQGSRIKRIEYGISLSIAFVGIYVLANIPVSGTSPLVEMDKLYSLIYFVFIFWSGMNIVTCGYKRQVLSACLIGAVFSFFVISGNYLWFYGQGIYLYNVKTILAVFLILTWIFTGICIWIMEKMSGILYENRVTIGRLSNGHFFLLIWLFIILAWTPVFLAVYPGIYSYDASPQILQVFGGEGYNLTTHHPVLHTLLLSFCMKMGNWISGDYNTGMVIYTVIQVGVISGIFSYFIMFLRKLKVPVWILVVSILYLTFNPSIFIMTFITTKDILFGGFLLLLVLCMIEAIKEPEKKKEKIWCVKYIVIASLMCLFRNQGIYILFFATILSWFIVKKSRRNIVVYNLIAIFLVCILNGPIFSMVGIEKGDSREMLSVPMQQLAKVYNEEKLNDSEKEMIETLIDKKSLNNYVSRISDPVKSGFHTDVLMENKAEYLNLWFQLFLKYPKSYMISFLDGCYGYWYFDETVYWDKYILFDGAFMTEDSNILKIERDSKLPILEEKLREISYNQTYKDVPLFSFIFNQAFPTWCLVFCLALAICLKKYELLVPLGMLGAYFGTLLLGPVVGIRYVYPLLVCTPAMVGMFFVHKGEE